MGSDGICLMILAIRIEMVLNYTTKQDDFSLGINGIMTLSDKSWMHLHGLPDPNARCFSFSLNWMRNYTGIPDTSPYSMMRKNMSHHH